MLIGLAPAVTCFKPSRKIASANTVAVVVPSPATSLVLLATSRTICAPMFSHGSSNSISFVTVTPSLVMVGEPNFLSSTTFRPLGPSVTLTARLSFSTPRNSAFRASSSNFNCLAAIVNHSFASCSLFNHAEDVVLAHDQVILLIDLDLRATVLADQHAIALLDFKRDELAVFISLAGAHGDDLAFLRLLFRRVRDDDPALLHFVLLDRLHQHPVAQWFDVHCYTHSSCLVCGLRFDTGGLISSSFRRPPSRNLLPRHRFPYRPSSGFRPAWVQRRSSPAP